MTTKIRRLQQMNTNQLIIAIKTAKERDWMFKYSQKKRKKFTHKWRNRTIINAVANLYLILNMATYRLSESEISKAINDHAKKVFYRIEQERIAR